MTTSHIDPVCGKPVYPESGTPSAECAGETHYFCSRACQEKYTCNPGRRLHEYLFDLAIVGGGPAGISAGIYASLNGIDSLFLTKSLGGQAWDSTSVVNFPGFEFITGPELVERFQSQLFDGLHLNHQICGVKSIEKHQGLFRIETEKEEVYRTRTVLLTTGMKRRRLGVPGEDRFRGKGVAEFHALSAERFRGKTVVVVGGGNSAAQAALGLADIDARVTLATRSYRADEYLKEKLAHHERIDVVRNRDPVRIEGEERVTAFVVRNQDTDAEEVIPTEAVFVEVGLIPNSDLVADIVHINDRGEVEIDGNCRTGLPGLYAAGDVTNTFGKRILIAAGEGAKAVLAMEQYILRIKARETDAPSNRT